MLLAGSLKKDYSLKLTDVVDLGRLLLRKSAKDMRTTPLVLLDVVNLASPDKAAPREMGSGAAKRCKHDNILPSKDRAIPRSQLISASRLREGCALAPFYIVHAAIFHRRKRTTPKLRLISVSRLRESRALVLLITADETTLLPRRRFTPRLQSIGASHLREGYTLVLLAAADETTLRHRRRFIPRFQ